MENQNWKTLNAIVCIVGTIIAIVLFIGILFKNI